MIKLGIIGVGYWGPNLLRNFSSMDDASIQYICDTSKSRLEKISNQYKHIKVTPDYKELLRDKDIDAVIIATPARTHYKIIKDSLLAKKHVLAEKPLTINVKDGTELVALAKRNKCKLMVGHTFLYNPAVRRVKELLNANKIGKIYYLNAVRTHLGLVREDIDVAWDLAPHDISIFNYLLGAMPQSVSAMGSSFLKPNRKDVAFIDLVYPGGILANIHVSWADTNKERTIKVVGSHGKVVFNDLDNLEAVKIYEKGISIDNESSSFGEFKYILRDGDIISPMVKLMEPLKIECLHFIEVIKSNKKPFTDGENGLEVVKVMCAIQKSIAENGKLIKIK